MDAKLATRLLGRIEMHRRRYLHPRDYGLCSLGLFFVLSFSVISLAQADPGRIFLPIEVMGDDGTFVSTAFEIAPGEEKRPRYLWLRVHGLEYPDMASIQINQGSWIALNNQTVDIAEPGKSYGGIGGGFATLQLTRALSEGELKAGLNRIQFRFNHSNGVSSGFRILSFNLLTANRQPILSPNMFAQDDPNLWLPPRQGPLDVSDGERWWKTATLRASSQAEAGQLRVHCADCHSRDGRDLKYYNYSNHSIVVRSRFHGLSTRQGEQIASYIRSLPFPNPGRPWNPPYQPGPGLTHKPASEWAAGAGLDWVLVEDSQALAYVFPSKGDGAGLLITSEAFSPDGNLAQRDIPIAMQLPDWNHWLPAVHPLDAWGERFATSEVATLYQRSESSPLDSEPGFSSFFNAWLRARKQLLSPPATSSKRWSPELANRMYSTLLWQLVKTWELTQEFHLEAPDRKSPSPTAGLRSWLNTIPEATAPASANIPNGPNGMGGRAINNEYFDNAWYELQILLNDGDHQHHGRTPVDWVYIAGHVRELQRLSGVPEPGRLIVLAIKATQSSKPTLGPENVAEGWRPDQNIDPRMIVAPEWDLAFARLPAAERQSVAAAWLTAWLDKDSRYPIASYFFRGQLPDSYAPPKELREISGGKVWEAASRFHQAGVDPAVVLRLQTWGAAYLAGASLFHY